jgi:hypothetical protein
MKKGGVRALIIGAVFAFTLFGCAHADPKGGSGRTSDSGYDKPGFYTKLEGGRLWVFRQDAKELKEFKEKGELTMHVIRPGAGSGGVTLKAPDKETIMLYLASKPGFSVFLQEGRLWVFREGAKEMEEFRSHGELAKQVVRPGAGPGGLTLKAPDAETLNDYLKAF